MKNKFIEYMNNNIKKNKVKKNVLILLNGDINYDSRVKKIINSLNKKEKYSITLVSNRLMQRKEDIFELEKIRQLPTSSSSNSENVSASNPLFKYIILKVKRYLAFFIMTFVRWSKFFIWRQKAKKLILQHNIKPDIIHCNDFITLPLGIWFKKKILHSI